MNSWYNTNGATPGTPVNPLPDLISALAGGISGTGATHGITTTQLQSSGVLTPGATNFLNNRSYTTTIPKAYLSWILFDDQFKMVSSRSGAQQVGADNTFTPMVQNGLTAAKNGYLYVYVSNETPNINVYFDNLQVTHIKGPLLQEQSYYPFGLQMAGISDKAMGKLDSKNKFNGGVELEEDYGVNLYNTFYRQYDPQIGRFDGVDVMSEKTIGLSVYQFGINNPISYNDPWGDKESLPSLEEIIDRLWNSQFGGFWSSDTPATAFLYGDRGTEDFFGSGGSSGAGFMDNLAGAYSFIQGKSAAGNEVLNFDLSQAHNGDYYASSGYYMPSQGMDGGATMIKDLGHLRTNGLNYNWESSGIGFGENKGKNNGWGKAGTILGAADLSFESTIHGVNLAANTFRGSAAVTDLGKLGVKLGNYGKLTLEGTGNAMGVVGIVITGVDMYQNGVNWSNSTDLAMGAVAFVPGVGWIISGSYFLINEGVKSATGESIGDHLGHALNNPIIQNSMNDMANMPSF